MNKSIISKILLSLFLVICLSVSVMADELIINGGFESGASTGWLKNNLPGGASTSVNILQGSYPRQGGTWYAYLGDMDSTKINALGSLFQYIIIPANATSVNLSFYLNVKTNEPTNGFYDKMDVSLRTVSDTIINNKLVTYTEADRGSNTNGDYGYNTFDITSYITAYKGQQIILQFYVDTDSSNATIFRIDDVRVSATVTVPAQVTLGPTSLNFGDVQVGSYGEYDFSISHVNGTSPASGTVTTSSPYQIVSGSSFSISNGGAANVRVRFSPTSAISYTGYFATVNSSANFTNTNKVSLSGVGVNPTPTQGVINVNAKLDGGDWNGSLNYSLSGPMNFSGNTVSAYFQNRPQGTYTLTYNSGGPNGAIFSNITPSSSQTLSGGGSITFTLNFSSPIIQQPTANTVVGQSIGATTAMLIGTVNPNGAVTNAWFEWGVDTSYGSSSVPVNIGSGTTIVQQSLQISDLIPGTTYHFRIVGQNSAGRSNGVDANFIMPSPPTIPPTAKTGTVKNMGTTFATLEGTINPNGFPMEYWFEWGTSTNYESSTTVMAYGGNSTSEIPYSIIITGLSMGTRYHFRLVAKNSAGRSNGLNQTFIHGASSVAGFNTQAGIGGDPVNTSTGSYTYQRKDLEIPGKSLSFIFERTYNSQDSQIDGPLGFGWNHSFKITSTFISQDSSVVIRWGDGRTETYTPNGIGGFLPPSGVFDLLTNNGDGTYTFKKKDLTRYNFDTSGRLSSIVDKNENTITLTYEGNNLKKMIDTVGRDINLNYENNRITLITDPIERTIKFEYSGNGNLEKVTDMNGKTTTYTYNSNHQMESIIDPRNNTIVTSTYDSLNRVESQLDAAGGQTKYIYDEDNRKTAIIDPLNNTYYHYYDSALRLVREEDALGNTIDYSYNSAGNRVEVKDKNDNITKYGYDSTGNVISKIDAYSTTSIKYNTDNNPTEKIDALYKTTKFEYDAKGNIVKTIDPLYNTTTITYYPDGQPWVITDSKGNITTNKYDTAGNLTEVINALGDTTSFIYDGAGRSLKNIDAMYNTTEYTYDSSNNLLTITDPLNNEISYTYDGNYNKLTEVDAMYNTTRYEYDIKDRIYKITDPIGNTVINNYDSSDRKISVKDKNGNINRYDYDEAGNLTKITDALGNVIKYEYDPNGNKTAGINPLGQKTTYEYDALNRLTTVTDPSGNKTTNVYDALGRITSVINAKNQTTSFEYDALSRLLKVTDAMSGIVSYSYDANGNREKMIDSNYNTTQYEYDELNRLKEKIEALGNTYTYTYNEVGNQVSMTDANNKTTSYTYYKNNRLKEITYHDNSTVTFIYDKNGNKKQMVDSLGTTIYSYDVLNRLNSYTDSFGKTVGYGYDANGNRKLITYPGSKTVNYSYDSTNRLISVTDWNSKVTGYDYDSAGNLKNVSNPNGTVANYNYASAGQLTGLSNLKSDSTVISSYIYTLDEIGNHKSVDQNEPLAPILTSKNIAYTYDDENRLTDAGGVSISYDANGNMKTKGSDSFTYDYSDRLINSNIGGVLTDYGYDGVGNRLVKTKDGVTAKYVLDINGRLSHILAETDENGNITSYYVYGLGLISKVLPNNTTYYYHYDSRGSTIALTDADQNITDKYAYNSFGNTTINGNTPNPFKYLGRYGVMDEGNGLDYIRARYYAPEFGRFITKDPNTGNDKDGQSLNRYVYALNNPVIMVDVDGEIAFSLSIAVGSYLFSKFILTPIMEKTILRNKKETGEGIVKDVTLAVITGISGPLGSVLDVVNYSLYSMVGDKAEVVATEPKNGAAIDAYGNIYSTQGGEIIDNIFKSDEKGVALDASGNIYADMQGGEIIDNIFNNDNKPLISEIAETQSYKYKTYKK